MAAPVPALAHPPVAVEATGPTSADEARMRRRARLLGLAAAGAAALLVAAHPATLTPGQAVLAAAVGLLGLAPAVLYLRAGAREAVPLIALHGLFYSVAFGFVTFFPRLEWMGTAPPAITTALWLVLAGVASLYAGYVGTAPLARRLRPLRIPRQVGPRGLRAWAWAFFAAHLALQYVPRVAAFASLPHLLYPLGWLAMGLLFIQHLRGELPRAHRWVFFGLALPAELFSRFVTGALYEFVMVFVFLTLVHWRLRRRILWWSLALVVGFFLLLNPVKVAYRQVVKTLPAGSSPLVKAMAFADVTAFYYSGRAEEAGEIVTGSSLNRLGFVPLFAYVAEATPAVVPYWEGQTYRYFLTAWVPRALWPEKPGAAFGNEFGHRYGILASNIYDTSINLPWLVEFYANHGPAGVVVGMALVGALLRLLVRKVDRPAANDCEYVLGLTLCFQLFWAESNVAIMWGGLVQTWLALYAMLWVASRRWRW